MWQYVVEPTTTLGNFVIHIGTHESDGMQIHTLSPSTAVNSPRISTLVYERMLEGAALY
jgi:hypothetical protein